MLLCAALLLTQTKHIYAVDIVEKSSLKDGLYLVSDDGQSSAHIDLRVQSRFSSVNYDIDFGNPNSDSKDLYFNRVRFKMGGKLGASWLKYYMEYDFVKPALLDLWIAPKVSTALHFRIGQYKVPYNRERFDSSGKQSFVERSIVTPPFTLDRQIGVTAMGRLFQEEVMDSNYYVGLFFGTGRDGEWKSQGSPMVFGRWQWNIFQQVLPFSRSDISRHQKPAASLSIAATSYKGPFTKFSTSGAEALPGFEIGESSQYAVNQSMIEFALMYKGFALQSEYHYKHIDDRINATTSKLSGYYIDVGYFFSELIEEVPKPLEIIARYARVDSDALSTQLNETELAFGANWYFYGHRNKLTFDVSRRTNENMGEYEHSWDTRFQWDVSF